MAWIQLALALFLFAWSLLALFEAPHDLLWKPAIAATEWGHLFVCLCLAVAFLPGWRARPGQVGLALALVGALVFLSPMLRARPLAADLPERLRQAFGDQAPLELEGARALPGPLEWGALLGIESPPVELTHHSREAGGRSFSYDLYLRADAPQPAPLVLMIHGGSWQRGDPGQLPEINRYLAARGYGVLSISYRLAPADPFPAAHEDVLAAIRWAKAEGPALGLDGARIALMGRSAGGHLALLAGYAKRDPAVRGVVAYYPVSDMIWSWEHPSNPWVLDSPAILRDFLGGDPSEAAEHYRQASPMHFAKADSPPTLLIHGGRDELVLPEQSRRFAARLKELGVPHVHLALPWATHGCDANLAGPSGQLSTYAIERFLAATLRK